VLFVSEEKEPVLGWGVLRAERYRHLSAMGDKEYLLCVCWCEREVGSWGVACV